MFTSPRTRPASGELFSEEFMSGLDRKIKSRDDYSSLVRNGLVPDKVTSRVSAAKVMLKRGLLEDKISEFLHSRPDAEDLLRQHILEEGYNSGVSPAIMKAQKEYEAARRRDLLHRNIQRRAERDDLVRNNILKGVHMAESQRASREALKRSMLEDKLNKAFDAKRRPTREELIGRGVVIEDVYDKVMNLEGDEARELLLRLALRGGLWGDQINNELDELLGAESVDTDRLERKLSMRPTADELKNLNILKMRGSEVNTKFLATRTLSKSLKSRPTRDELEKSNIYHESGSKVPMRRKSELLSEKLGGRINMADLRERGILI